MINGKVRKNSILVGLVWEDSDLSNLHFFQSSTLSVESTILFIFVYVYNISIV